MNTERGHFWWWLGLALLVSGLDQATKAAASAWLTFGVPLRVVPGFNLTLLHNTGAAFSLLDDGAGWQRWLFAAIALAVAVGVVVWLALLDRAQRWAPCALALILGGAIGNLIDRIHLGYVVDFIQIYYAQWSWPAFNIADSAISIGACMLLVRGPGYRAVARAG